MAERTPADEQALIDAEIRIGKIGMVLERFHGRADDTIRDTKHRRVMEAEDRARQRKG